MKFRLFHKAISLLLVFILLSNSTSNIVIITDFVINQDFIAKTLCIQKEAPKGCNGKCQLTKRLEENNPEDNNTDTPVPTNNRTRLDVFLVSNDESNAGKGLYILSEKSDIDIRSRCPITRFYDIETPPPNLS